VGSPRRLSSSGSGSARLEDGFHHVLSSHAVGIEIDALADLGSLSINGDRSNSVSSADLPTAGDDEEDVVSSAAAAAAPTARLRSIRKIDLLKDDTVADLYAIASRMAAAGYGRKCVQVYASVRKPVVDASLCRLGVERLTIGDVQRLEWQALEAKIRCWIRAAVRGVFASKRRLCFHIRGQNAF
jgi:exocyst complex component 7